MPKKWHYRHVFFHEPGLECCFMLSVSVLRWLNSGFHSLAFILLWEHHWTLPQKLDLHWQSMINDWSLYPAATFTLVHTAKQQRLLLMAFIALALISEWMHTQQAEMNIHMHWKHIFITECVTWHVSLLPPNWISWPQCRNTAALGPFRATYGFQKQISFPKFIWLLSEKTKSFIVLSGQINVHNYFTVLLCSGFLYLFTIIMITRHWL